MASAAEKALKVFAKSSGSDDVSLEDARKSLEATLAAMKAEKEDDLEEDEKAQKKKQMKAVETQIENLTRLIDEAKALEEKKAKVALDAAKSFTDVMAQARKAEIQAATDLREEIISGKFQGLMVPATPDEIILYEQKSLKATEVSGPLAGKLVQKIPTFSGEPTELSWEAFALQMRMVAMSRNFSEAELKMLLLQHMTGRALAYVTANQDEILSMSYGDIMRRFEQVYAKSMSASIHQLKDIVQYAHENVREYETRLQNAAGVLKMPKPPALRVLAVGNQ